MTPPKLAVVMVGTNDLGYTEACFRNGDEVTEADNGTISRCDRLLHHIFRDLGSVALVEACLGFLKTCFRPADEASEAASATVRRSGITANSLPAMLEQIACTVGWTELGRMGADCTPDLSESQQLMSRTGQLAQVLFKQPLSSFITAPIPPDGLLCIAQDAPHLCIHAAQRAQDADPDRGHPAQRCMEPARPLRLAQQAH